MYGKKLRLSNDYTVLHYLIVWVFEKSNDCQVCEKFYFHHRIAFRMRKFQFNIFSFAWLLVTKKLKLVKTNKIIQVQKRPKQQTEHNEHFSQKQ